MNAILTLDSTIVAVEEQLTCDLSGEVVILNLKNGVYYGLNSIGAHVWALIKEPAAVRNIRDFLLEEYEVNAEDCERDLLALLQELANNQLIETLQ